MNTNLLMSIIWLVLGGALLFWHYIKPAGPDFTIRGTGISAGWLGVILALYNLVRWWSSRSAIVQRRRFDETTTRRGLQEIQKQPAAPRSLDPTFDFTKLPLPLDSGGPENKRPD